MSEKRTEINQALKKAMIEKDQVTLSTVRLLMAALKDRDINARGAGKGDQLSDEEILSLIQSMIKQRHESSKVYRDGGREDLAELEEQEIKVLEGFLPAQMGEDEILHAVEGIMLELGVNDIKDMGKVMTELKTRYAGQMDMGRASGIVKQRLAA